AAIVLQISGDIRVRVPTFVVDVHEAHATLDHPASEQTGTREGRLVRIASIHFERFFALALQVHQLGCGGLKAVCHFVRGNARFNLRVADNAEVRAIEFVDQIDGIALEFWIDSFWGRDVKDRIALIPETDASVHGGQKAAGPIGRTTADSRAGGHYNERRKIF